MASLDRASSLGARGLARDLLARSGGRRLLAAALAATLVHLAATLSVPVVVARVLDAMLAPGGSTIAPHVPLLAGLTGLACLRALAGAARRYATGALATGIAAAARLLVVRRAQEVRWGHGQPFTPGDMLARVSTDVEAVEQLVHTAPLGLQAAVLGAGGTIVLLVIQPALAVATCTVVAVAGWAAFRRMPVLRHAAVERQASLAGFATFADERLRFVSTVRAQGTEARHVELGARLAADAADAGFRLTVARTRYLATFVVGPHGGTLVVLGFGGWLATTGAVSPGELVAFLQYLALATGAVLSAAQLVSSWPQARAGLVRIDEVLSTPPAALEVPRPVPLPDGPGEVTFAGVSVQGTRAIPVLDGLDLVVPGGSTVAVTGPSGAGKTALAHLLCRLVDPDRGQVLLDGTDVAQLSLDTLRSAVVPVFEETVLFSTSIADNVRCGRPDAGDRDVDDAIELAGLGEVVASLPDGLDTLVGDRGTRLSGGQRQRVALARALVARPRVVVLDGATSALDPDTRRSVVDQLVRATRDVTVVAVTSDPELLAAADQVVVLDAGRVVATGPPGVVTAARVADPAASAP